MFEKRSHQYEIEGKAVGDAYRATGLVLEVQVDTDISESWNNLQSLLDQNNGRNSLFIRKTSIWNDGGVLIVLHSCVALLSALSFPNR